MPCRPSALTSFFLALSALLLFRSSCPLAWLDGLINIYAYPGVVPIIIVYAATAIGGELRADDESLDAAWFSSSDIPWSALAFPSTLDALRDYQRGLLYPELL